MTATLSRTDSRVLSTRLSRAQFKRARQLFARRGLSPSAYTRRMLSALTGGDPKAARAMLDDLLAAIGVPPGASKADALAALEELFEGIDMDEVPADGGEPLDEVPDPEPVSSFAARGKAAKLSAKELAECKRRGITPAAFLKAKAAAARRTAAPKAAPSKPAPVKLSAADRELCAKRGIDPKDFLRRKRDAAKRR